VKQFSIFVLGFATIFASASAPAQDLTAGKTPAQLFRSDCAECHRSPSGLARTRDVRTLAEFLGKHYTTKSETAGALAAYVSAFAPGGAAARSRGTGVAAPATDGYPRLAGEIEARAKRSRTLGMPARGQGPSKTRRGAIGARPACQAMAKGEAWTMIAKRRGRPAAS